MWVILLAFEGTGQAAERLRLCRCRAVQLVTASQSGSVGVHQPASSDCGGDWVCAVQWSVSKHICCGVSLTLVLVCSCRHFVCCPCLSSKPFGVCMLFLSAGVVQVLMVVCGEILLSRNVLEHVGLAEVSWLPKKLVSRLCIHPLSTYYSLPGCCPVAHMRGHQHAELSPTDDHLHMHHVRRCKGSSRSLAWAARGRS